MLNTNPLANHQRDLLGIGTAIGSIASSIGDAVTQRKNTNKTIAANKQMAQYQYSKDLEMWNKGNEYNSPTAQMARLKEAGLNPNMVYGSGQATGNTASQLPKFQAPTIDYNYKNPLPDLGGALGAFQDTKLKKVQIDNMNAQRQIMYEDWRIKNAQADWAEKMARLKYDTGAQSWEAKEEERSHLRGIRPTQRALAQGQLSVQEQNVEKLKADIKYKNLQNQWFDLNQWTNIAGAAGGLIGKGVQAGKAMFKGATKGGSAKAVKAVGKQMPTRTPMRSGREHPSRRVQFQQGYGR